MQGMMGGMMANSWIWTIVGVLVIVMLIIVIMKLLRR